MQDLTQLGFDMYLTPQDFSKLFGDAETLTLCDRQGTGILDLDILNNALSKASAEVDSYLATRYPLPLTQAPEILVSITADITRYRLTGGDLSESSPILIRYAKALAWLKDIVAGRASLPINKHTQDAAQIHINAGQRPWQRLTI